MRIILLLAIIQFYSTVALAQADNEIQVYASPTVGKNATIFELHSNYTFKGIKDLPDPNSAHYLNESLEITHGFGDNFELGLYIFTTLTPDGKYEYLGSHIRPRVTVPESWKWKIGASLSAEFGFFRQGAEQDYYWEGEIRPVVDKTAGNWYFSLNPNINFVLTGDNKHWGFGPQFKTVYTIRQKLGVGFEYYTELGSFQKISPVNEEEHLLGPMIDLYLSPKWEFNGGFLFGLTPNSNQQILKILIGRRAGK
jgi:hypothetical protein